MNFITINPGDENSKKLFENPEMPKFKIEGNFFRDTTNIRKVNKIRAKMMIDDPKSYFYNLESIKFCDNVLSGLDFYMLELNLRITTTKPNKYEASMELDNLTLNKGTIIYNVLHIYQIGDNIKDCQYDPFGFQPDHKKGNIIVGYP